MLEALHQTPGQYLGLCTGNTPAGARLKLTPPKLNKYFPFGGFGDIYPERVAMTRHAITLGLSFVGEPLSTEQIFVIGDTAADIRSAKVCGATAVAVLTGWGKPKEMRALNPEIMVSDLKEFKELLGL